MKKSLAITIGSVNQAAREVIDAWHRAEHGKKAPESRAEILFTDLETLLKTLTLQRFRLLRQLRRSGPTSIRALAKALGRDYKNVHRDVIKLLRLGMIEKNEAGQILVPWDEIDARLDLAA
ncbi:HVO_A0114 family putative DNA-binding protein [Methylohalobius crimeensis]|uniref:HVO_A0114 family putative DNA-binding protein n=1 Tax=Methylohalobius crimeensis TaxID=244365 RepID=UPI0003B74C38|nr:MarR family transcriptional regulator [Methylohalobius crimeensis]